MEPWNIVCNFIKGLIESEDNQREHIGYENAERKVWDSTEESFTLHTLLITFYYLFKWMTWILLLLKSLPTLGIFPPYCLSVTRECGWNPVPVHFWTVPNTGPINWLEFFPFSWATGDHEIAAVNDRGVGAPGPVLILFGCSISNLGWTFWALWL